MDYKLAVVILTAVACFSLKDNSVLAQSECTLVENTSDKCHSANYIKRSKRYTKVWKRELNFQAGKEKSDGYAGRKKKRYNG